MSRRVRAPLLAALAALLAMTVAASPLANAQSRRDKREAAKHESQGKAFYRTGAYDNAIAEFEQAYELAPKPSLLFNIGICYERLGNIRLARDYYQRYLETNPNAGVTETRARIEGLDRRIAEEDAKAQAAADAEDRRAKAGNLRGEAAELVEGEMYAEAIARYNEAFELTKDPEIVFELAEALRLSGDKVNAAVEYQRYRDLAPSGPHAPQALEYKAKLEAEVQEEIAEAERKKRDAAKEQADEEKRRRRAATAFERMPSGKRLRIAGIATAGVGGVALLVGAAFGAKAKGLENDVSGFDGPWTTELDQKVDDGESANKLAVTSYVVGGLAVAAGGAMYYIGTRRAKAKRRARKQLSVTPAVTPDSAGFVLSGSF